MRQEVVWRAVGIQGGNGSHKTDGHGEGHDSDTVITIDGSDDRVTVVAMTMMMIGV